MARNVRWDLADRPTDEHAQERGGDDQQEHEQQQVHGCEHDEPLTASRGLRSRLDPENSDEG